MRQQNSTTTSLTSSNDISSINDSFNNNNETFVSVCRNESIIPQFAPALVDASIPVIMSLSGCNYMVPETSVSSNQNSLIGQKSSNGVTSNEYSKSSTTSVISNAAISNDVNNFKHAIEEEKSSCSIFSSTSTLKSNTDDDSSVLFNAQSNCILTPIVVDLSIPSTSDDYIEYSTLISASSTSNEIAESSSMVNPLNNNCGTLEQLNKAVITLTCENSRRMAVKRRHSLQQKDEEASCRSTMAATADEAIFFEPSTKFLKADSPGEAYNGFVII